jgi:transforming growth factor-beta-induced protein
LANTLLEADAITVFAPTNEAFGDALEAYGVTTLGQLVTELGGVANLEAVLGFHVVPAVAFAEDLAEGDQTFTTLADQELTVNKTGAAVTVTDAAGSTYNVVTADVAIENGVVHVIDGVLLPEITLPTVVEAATAAGLTTLIDALVAAELDDDVANAEAVTVFAPTNAAFTALLEAQEVTDLDGLITKLGAAAVADVLTFHVVPAVAFSHDLSNGDTFTTLQGEDLTVNIDSEGAVTVTDVNDNTFNVTPADVAIANGVVHVIDGVLLPTL